MGVASDTYARLTREQYDDWYKRFYPKQQQLLEDTQSGKLLNQQLNRVDENFESAQQASQVSQNNQMARYGLSSAKDSSSNAKTALAQVSTKNSLRDYEKERSMGTLSGAGYALKSASSNS